MTQGLQDSSKSAPARPLLFREKVCYGIGDVANGLALSSAGFWLLIYLTDVAGLSPGLAGLALMVGRCWDAVTDPVMGWITDNTKSRWGKRRPYLLFGAPFYALAFFSIWTIPEFSDQTMLFLYAATAFIVFNTFFTVVFLPYTSLTAVMTDDYNERTSLTGFRMIASQTSFLIGAVIPPCILMWVTSPGYNFFRSDFFVSLFGGWTGSARQAYFMMAVFFAFMMWITIWIAFFWGTREQKQTDSGAAGHPLSYVKELLYALTKNKPYRSAVLIILITNVAATLIAVNLPFYLQYVLGLSENQQAYVVGTLFLAAVVSLPLWIVLTSYFGKSLTYSVAMLLFCVVITSLAWVPEGGYKAVLVVAGAAGFFYAAALMIPWAIIPDVVEYDQFQTGQRREGLLYGGTTFCYKLASGLALFLSSQVLEVIDYVPNVVQEPHTVSGIRLLISISPPLMLCFGIMLAYNYPLTRKKHSEVRAALRKLEG